MLDCEGEPEPVMPREDPRSRDEILRAIDEVEAEVAAPAFIPPLSPAKSRQPPLRRFDEVREVLGGRPRVALAVHELLVGEPAEEGARCWRTRSRSKWMDERLAGRRSGCLWLGTCAERRRWEEGDVFSRP